MVQEKVENIFGELLADEANEQRLIDLNTAKSTKQQEIIELQNTLKMYTSLGASSVSSQTKKIEVEISQLKDEIVDIEAREKNLKPVKVINIRNASSSSEAISNDNELELAIDRFFNRISMDSFIEAFVAVILLRPQDGVIGFFDNSNILFQAIPQGDNINPLDPTIQLRPVLIDLDETIPADNEKCLDPRLTNNGKETKHAVRNGLMAFPQSQNKLSERDKLYAETLMIDIINQEDNISQLLEKREMFTPAHVSATKEIIQRMGNFVDNQPDEWSLQDLFFTLFPDYKKQWDALDPYPPAYKAQIHGKASVESFPELVRQLNGNQEIR